MISSRLTKIAELIKDDHDVADIGSDHGLLLILLNNRKFPKKVLGVENKVGPYKNLEKTVLSINNPNFSSNLSSGLKKVDINYQTIVIAGMGFATIKEIVLDDIKKGHKRETFIIDCHTNQNEVRSFFYELGYKIDRILTGGYSKIIRNEIVCFHYEEDLALEGLYQIYLLNNGGKE